jgi:hypothetical protein
VGDAEGFAFAHVTSNEGLIPSIGVRAHAEVPKRDYVFAGLSSYTVSAIASYDDFVHFDPFRTDPFVYTVGAQLVLEGELTVSDASRLDASAGVEYDIFWGPGPAKETKVVQLPAPPPEPQAGALSQTISDSFVIPIRFATDT